MLIVGPRDAENEAVSVRARGAEKDSDVMPMAKPMEDIPTEIVSKSAVLGVKP
jgi:threonyl-tRNA synthetase